MKSSAHGLVLDKFYPPHAGHELLIRTAAELCERVSVVVMASSHETIPVATRVSWLREIHADARHVSVTGVVDESCIDNASTTSRARHVAQIHSSLEMMGGPPVATVFSAEPYGTEFARAFHAMPVTLDFEQLGARISSARVRADVEGHWAWLAGCVRRDLALRVVVVGAESTGATTLSLAITQALRDRGGVHALTRCVPDFSGEYSLRKHALAAARAQLLGASMPRVDQLAWDTDDFLAIANEQRRIERDNAAYGGPLLVCDSDSLATGLWHERHLGAMDRDVDALARPFGDLYVVTHHEGVAFKPGGTRDSQNQRASMTARFVERLSQLHLPQVLVEGTPEARLAQAMEAVASAERVAWQLASPAG